MHESSEGALSTINPKARENHPSACSGTPIIMHVLSLENHGWYCKSMGTLPTHLSGGS